MPPRTELVSHVDGEDEEQLYKVRDGVLRVVAAEIAEARLNFLDANFIEIEIPLTEFDFGTVEPSIVFGYFESTRNPAIQLQHHGNGFDISLLHALIGGDIVNIDEFASNDFIRFIVYY